MRASTPVCSLTPPDVVRLGCDRPPRLVLPHASAVLKHFPQAIACESASQRISYAFKLPRFLGRREDQNVDSIVSSVHAPEYVGGGVRGVHKVRGGLPNV